MMATVAGVVLFSYERGAVGSRKEAFLIWTGSNESLGMYVRARAGLVGSSIFFYRADFAGRGRGGKAISRRGGAAASGSARGTRSRLPALWSRGWIGLPGPAPLHGLGKAELTH